MGRRISGLVDLPAYEGAIRLVLYHLDGAKRATVRLGSEGDDEALHDFRVALRRLRSALQAFAPHLATAVSRKRRRRVRDLAVSTSACRDLEVQLAWLDSRWAEASPEDAPGIEGLRRDLESRFEAEYERVLEEAPPTFRKIDRKLRRRLDNLRTSARASGLDHGLDFSTALERRLAEYAAALEVQLSRVHTPSDGMEAHRARIRAKRLRYLLEPVESEVEGVAETVGELKELQDLLGDLRDAQLLASRVADLEQGEAAEGPASEEMSRGLRSIRHWLDADQRALFTRLRDSWLGERSAPFFDRVESVRGSLSAAGSVDFEIERKYLLSGVPTVLRDAEYREIEQGYLPGRKLQERVRRVRTDGSEWFVRSVKVGHGMRRIELQEETDPETYRVLWPLTAGRRVNKRRYRVAEGALTWEVDEFTDRDLVLAEVELPSEDSRPALPEWLVPHVVREVTGEAAYLNVNLAR